MAEYLAWRLAWQQGERSADQPGGVLCRLRGAWGEPESVLAVRLRRGAHWSDQPAGRSGYWRAYVAIFPAHTGRPPMDCDEWRILTTPDDEEAAAIAQLVAAGEPALMLRAAAE